MVRECSHRNWRHRISDLLISIIEGTFEKPVSGEGLKQSGFTRRQTAMLLGV
jgi:hypothetical protein